MDDAGEQEEQSPRGARKEPERKDPKKRHEPKVMKDEDLVHTRGIHIPLMRSGRNASLQTNFGLDQKDLLAIVYAKEGGFEGSIRRFYLVAHLTRLGVSRIMATERSLGLIGTMLRGKGPMARTSIIISMLRGGSGRSSGLRRLGKTRRDEHTCRNRRVSIRCLLGPLIARKLLD